MLSLFLGTWCRQVLLSERDQLADVNRLVLEIVCVWVFLGLVLGLDRTRTRVDVGGTFLLPLLLLLISLFLLVAVLDISRRDDVDQIFVCVSQVHLQNEDQRVPAEVAQPQVTLKDRLAALVADTTVAAVHNHCISKVIEADAAAVLVAELLALQQFFLLLLLLLHRVRIRVLGHLGV